MIDHAHRRLPGRLFAAALMLFSLPANADEAIIDRWYRALADADRAGLSALLADTARIKLVDLGVEQSKAEFLGSMDEWREAVSGATIRHRIETERGAVTTVLACYDFPANDVLVRETFTLASSAIVETIQTAVAEDCSSF